MLVITWAIIAIFPIYWMVTMAFKPKTEWTSAAGTIYWVPQEPDPGELPDGPHRVPRQVLPRQPGIGAAVHPEQHHRLRSRGTLFALVIGTLAAYGLSRFTTETG